MPLSVSSRGVYPISPTPFLPDGEIDFNSIGKLVEFYRKAGSKGIAILGILGEAPKLDFGESIDVINAFAEKKGTMDLIVGVSSPGFASMRTLAREAMKAGASAVLLAPPNTLRTDDQILAYYAAAAETLTIDTPFIIHDYPLIQQVVISPVVIREIVNRHPSCVALKHEDWPGLDKLRTLKGYMREDKMRGVAIFPGFGGMFMDFEYDNGVDGIMTGYAFPDMLVQALEMSVRGEKDRMHDLFDAHLPYLRYESQPQVGLSIRKYVLRLRGAIDYETVRKPAMALSDASRKETDYLLTRLAAKTGVKI